MAPFGIVAQLSMFHQSLALNVFPWIRRLGRITPERTSILQPFPAIIFGQIMSGFSPKRRYLPAQLGPGEWPCGPLIKTSSQWR